MRHAHHRDHRRRLGRMPAPIALPELDGVYPAHALPDDAPPPASVEWAPWYDYDGAPLGGDLTTSTARYQVLRQAPGAYLRARPFYRAGHRVVVSTAFIGVDMGFNNDRPLVWETMIFHGGHGRDIGTSHECWHYATKAAAYAGHRLIVATIAAAQRQRRAAWRTTAPMRHHIDA